MMNPDKLEKEFKKLVEERDKALLSFDKETVMRYYLKYGNDRQFVFRVMTMSKEEFETVVHTAITGCRTIPKEKRLESKTWLEERGIGTSLDDGDLETGD